VSSSGCQAGSSVLEGLDPVWASVCEDEDEGARDTPSLRENRFSAERALGGSG
jgi:hypothetical protein